MDKTVGVLAIQGDFERHIYQLGLVGARPVEVRLPGDLDKLDALILPGGESTTINIMIDRFDLRELLVRFGRSKPVFGTCAGMIMLAKKIENNTSNVNALGLLDIDVDRNGYGRQVHSWEDKVDADLAGQKAKLTATFIRAPRVTRVGPEIATLASWRNDPVLIRQNRLLAASFHAELDDDTTLLEYFLTRV
ncbi:MAG: pyridoxal 5'-phosphate synthase glutaminase subunit PdxT [Candidatus Zixiibacteriota bacterium]